VPGQRARPGYSRRKALVVGGVGVALAGALFTGLAVTNELSWDQTGSSTSSTTQPTGQQLRTGECLAGSNMDLGISTWWPGYVTVVACTKRHEAEVVFAGNIWPQSLAYPGKGAIGSQSDKRCDAAFAAYDGIDESQSAFRYDEILPYDPSDWTSGDRSLACVAYEPSPSGPSGGTPVDYSIKGSDN
jgi:hypothetical protein